MPRLTPVHYTKFEKFLKTIGCYFVHTKGDHDIWRKEGLIRPLVVRRLKDLPIREIQNNLRTLGISKEDYLKIILEI